MEDDVSESKLHENMNRRRREVLEAGLAEELRRSYSSTMFSRSSSVVTEMRESRSSFGSWYLSENDFPERRVLDRRRQRSERVVCLSTRMIRVSPPT